MKSNLVSLDKKGFDSLSNEELMNLDGGALPVIGVALVIKGVKIFGGGIAFGAGAKMTYNAIFNN